MEKNKIVVNFLKSEMSENYPSNWARMGPNCPEAPILLPLNLSGPKGWEGVPLRAVPYRADPLADNQEEVWLSRIRQGTQIVHYRMFGVSFNTCEFCKQTRKPFCYFLHFSHSNIIFKVQLGLYTPILIRFRFSDAL